MKKHQAFLLLLALWLAWPASILASEGAIEVKRTSHIDHQLILFDAHDRRYFLPDGEYSNSDGARLWVRQGRIAELRGCGPAPCRLTAHATRIVKNQLSIYAEVAIPDGRYEAARAAGARSAISFLIESGKLVELVDDSQVPKPPIPEQSVGSP